jgi:hypothetical protein
MQGSVSKHRGGPRLSARASIALWLVIAGLFWGTVGLAINYATQRDDGALRAEADELSRIAPAAGGFAAPGRNGQ